MKNKPNVSMQRNRFGRGCRSARMIPATLFGLLMLCASIIAPPAFAAGNVLKDISYSALPGNSVQITLTAENPVDQPNTFSTDNPARIALDFFGMTSGLAQKTLPIGVGMARSVTAIEAGERTRVVVNLVSKSPSEIKVLDNKVLITIEPGSQEMVAARPPTAIKMQRPAAAPTGAPRVDNVDFRRGQDGEGRVIIQLSDASTVVDMRQEAGNVVLDLAGVALPEKLMRKFDVSDFATPVQDFEVTASGNNVRVAINTSGEYEHLAYQANETFTVEFRPLTKNEKEELQRQKQTFSGERLSLNFQDIQVRAVLQLLADFTGLNLVTSDTVRGRITLRLQNVPWDQALDIILKARGLSMRQNGNVIMVAPTEEIAAREKLELESQKQIEELAPLRSEFLQINYAKATDIAKLLKSKGNELLTPGRGNVTVDTRTNTLLVRDTATKLEDIRRLVQRLDIPVRQVLIESRVVIANDKFAKDLGVRFGLTTQGSLSGTNNEFLIGGGTAGNIVGTAGLDKGNFMNVPASISTDGAEDLIVNLPSTLVGTRGSALNLLVGNVGNYLLQLELSAMQQEGKGEVLSSPRVITSDNHKAVIKQGVEIPYQEATSSGATSVSFKEAVLKLEVTPNITPDDRIIMDLVLNKDNPDFSRAVLGTPPVDTRSVETSVLVDNGETVVLGGVFERTNTQSGEKVPFFGDLPYVGFMFKQEFNGDENQELLFFVTPKILKEALSVR